MPTRSNRPRRAVSARQVRALRLVGFRYSVTRDAWVHRIGGGRIGPVFREQDGRDLGHARPCTKIFEAMIADTEPPVQAPAPAALPARTPRPTTSVRVALGDDEPPRTVKVDGRPPRRGLSIVAPAKATA